MIKEARDSMNKYLIVSDFDGTLADVDHHVNETTKTYIRELLDQGHIMVIATGRMKALVQESAIDIDPRVKIVGSNGAVIQTDEGFKLTHIEHDQKMEFYDYVVKNDVPALFFTDKDVYYTHFVPDFFNAPKSEGSSVIKIEDVKKHIHDNNFVNALILGHHLEKPELVLEPIRKELNKIMDLTVTSSNPRNLEIYSKEASKGNALLKLMKLHNIKKENVITFGDGYNDVSMFKESHTSVAMDNAPQGVKDLATHTTVSNGENGVVSFLRNYFK